jgi:mannose-1-phosphate guanylyltransferase/mannose-6-phosphate isomerase
MSLQPVILSGGSGTRLWPLSREAYPKQFLPLTSEHTMLQETVRRLDGLEEEHPHQAIGLLPPLIVCNEAHRFLVAEQLRVLQRASSGILLEPMGRNTAPALTLAALQARHDGADPLLLVMPADHTIANEAGFRQIVAKAYELASEGAVVTFGIVPDKPEIGYGYIHQGAAFGEHKQTFLLDGFREKPDASTAQQYLDSGDYYWNSGIFMMRASVWLQLIEQFRADIANACRHTFDKSDNDGDFLRLDEHAFAECPSDSIDYAVMERLAGAEGSTAEGSTKALVLPLSVGWSDVGAWSALWEVRDQDDMGNVMDGDAFVHDAHNNLLISQHRMVAAVGVDNLIVVETPDAVLVSSKDRSQDVKAVTQYLKKAQRSEFRHHRRSHRPWGDFEPIDAGERYQVKRLTVSPGHSLSLQMHHHRAEHWVVVSGTARVTNGEQVILLTENQSTYIPIGVKHRLENPGTIPLEIIEVQSGSYLGEDDIVRFEDIYNRDSSDT